jgi:hypothetical protein
LPHDFYKLNEVRCLPKFEEKKKERRKTKLNGDQPEHHKVAILVGQKKVKHWHYHVVPREIICVPSEEQG